MHIETQIQLIRELTTYLRTNNYKFKLTIKPVVYNFTLQTYTDSINNKINNMFVLYRSILSACKKNIEHVIQLLPEEQFIVYNIIDNSKHIFKITYDLLLKKICNTNINNLHNIFEDIFIDTSNSFYNTMSKIINTDTNENKIETILHARFLTTFLTINIQKLLTVNNTILINLLQIIESLKIDEHRLYIDLEYVDSFNTNSIISILVSIDINIQNKKYLSIKQELDNIFSKFDNYIEDIQYDKLKKSELNVIYIMKNTNIIHWLMLLYLLDNIQYV